MTLTGFASPRKEGGWYLTRMVLSCCAADARAVKIEVRGQAAPEEDTWVRLTGKWVDEGRPPGDDVIPAVEADGIERIAAPKDPYG